MAHRGRALQRMRTFVTAINRERLRRGISIGSMVPTRSARLFLLLIGLLAVLAGAFAWCLSYLAPVSNGVQITLDTLVREAAAGRVQTAHFQDFDHRIVGTYTAQAARPSGGGATAYWVTYPTSDSETPVLIHELATGGAAIVVEHQSDKLAAQFVAEYVLPLVMLANLFGIVFLATRSGGGGLGGIVEFGRFAGGDGESGSRRATLADVAGADAAVMELAEVRDYLADPGRFAALGAQPPKGVLMFGPPGCGKTLMARAVAGEADVPFFSVSGAEFVESLVGVGAARVRDLFRKVRRMAPAIVFIDELDAVGRRRGGLGGGQEEREGTLNQLLIEMDGFNATAGIVVIGATNRPDILDPALLRPGRFDRQVVVEPPDLAGRHAILELYARRRPVDETIDLESIARQTPGFTGADLANVINEAALLAVRNGRPTVSGAELDEALQRVQLGHRRRGNVLTPAERRRTAVHEAGHALAAIELGHGEQLRRVSIVARGRSSGSTSSGRLWQERTILTRDEMTDELVVLMAGAAAEQLVLGDTSTGSDADLEQATSLAQVMVGRYGMSERIGRARVLDTEGSEFLGGGAVPTEMVAPAVLEAMHNEVNRLMSEAEGRAATILAARSDALARIAAALESVETMDGDALVMLAGAGEDERALDGTAASVVALETAPA